MRSDLSTTNATGAEAPILLKQSAETTVFPKIRIPAILIAVFPQPRRSGVLPLSATPGSASLQPFGENPHAEVKKFGIAQKSFFDPVTP
jgi:hypothetical protein